MPFPVALGAPTLFIRRAAYESSGLARAAIDERLGLTADEWLDRWKWLLTNYAGNAVGGSDSVSRGLGGFANVVRRVSAASIDAQAQKKAAAAPKSGAKGGPKAARA